MLYVQVKSIDVSRVPVPVHGCQDEAYLL